MVRCALCEFSRVYFRTHLHPFNKEVSEEESHNFASKVLPPGLVVVHDSAGRCDDNFAVKSEMVY